MKKIYTIKIEPVPNYGRTELCTEAASQPHVALSRAMKQYKKSAGRNFRKLSGVKIYLVFCGENK